ncbi:SEFIR domain-containing protein [Chloroflexota bacterium]
MTNGNPKLFISYSWSNQDHEKWVINLANELVENGVDVILDKWHLKEGQDANVFMEKMVADHDIRKVVIICDRVYAQKADQRSGGVGTETQIISPEIYSKSDQSKFVAVLSEKDETGNPYLPIYYKSRIYIDLSNDELYASNFEQLLRWIYDKSLYIKPPIGKPPSFLFEENPISLETTTLHRRALDLIRSNKEHAGGALGEYLSTFTQNLEKFRVSYGEKEVDTFDDKVVDNINKFLPYRNELISVFFTLAQYRNTPEAMGQLHRFFESLIPYMYKLEHITHDRDWDYDNFRFIIHELFLYAVTCLLKYECFSSVSHLLNYDYYVERNLEYGRNAMVPFTIFGQPVKSLLHRNDRLKLRRLSIRADLLIQHSKASGITDRQLMQTDFVLFIRDAFDSIRRGTHQDWSPVTLVYAEDYSGPFEIFARAQSKEYFDRIKCLFDIKQKDDFTPLFDAFREGKLRVPRWEFSSFEPAVLLGFEKLATMS